MIDHPSSQPLPPVISAVDHPSFQPLPPVISAVATTRHLNRGLTAEMPLQVDYSGRLQFTGRFCSSITAARLAASFRLRRRLASAVSVVEKQVKIKIKTVGAY